MTYSDEELAKFLDEVETRYVRALDAKPGKGPITNIDALVDSVCDVPDLLRIIRSQYAELEDFRWRW